MEKFNHKKQIGITHFFAAGRYSIQGFMRACQESAFRQELCAGAILAIIYAIIGIDALTALIAVVSFLVLLAVEGVNTAIEEIVDRISPEFSVTAKNAKDLGSFAVVCLLLANGLLHFYVLYNSV